MAGVLDTVNQRTQLVGQNRLELLLFQLEGDQLYGINVFKVREVLHCPRLHNLPKSHGTVCGVAHIRGSAIAILDLGASIGLKHIEKPENHLVIITEYNMNIQGFLVRSVDRIINKTWETVLPPPKGAGDASYLTAVTHNEGKLIEILDVERILSDVSPVSEEVNSEFLEQHRLDENSETDIGALKKKILIVDDSSVARNQIKRTIKQLGVEAVMKNDGKAALDHLRKLVDNGTDPRDIYYMVVSDVEMPEMDGYTLVSELKNDPRTKDLFILLHTSLSGVFNKSMVEKVGADDFLPKFKANDLANRVAAQLHS